MEYTNRTAIATGAASGMGLLASRCFVEAGGSVVMTDINQEALDEKVAEVISPAVIRVVIRVAREALAAASTANLERSTPRTENPASAM